MHTATRRKPVPEPAGAAPARPAVKPKLDAVSHAKAAPVRPAAKPRLKAFHASVQVTRVEEWFVEAETAEEARQLLESGRGQRCQIGECLHFEIDKLID